MGREREKKYKYWKCDMFLAIRPLRKKRNVLSHSFTQKYFSIFEIFLILPFSTLRAEVVNLRVCYLLASRLFHD